MEYLVNGKKLTEEEFRELQQNSSIKLKEISAHEYKILEKMYS